MGSSPTKPEFVTVLADKYLVERGQTVFLQCKANTENIKARWEIKGSSLCVEGKHDVKTLGKTCSLEISDAEESDEGKYTLTVSNKSGSVSCSTIVRVVIKQWRNVKLERQDKMFNDLKTFKVHDSVEQLNFLLYGLVGVGKSSVINTIRTIFEGRSFVNCLAAAGSKTSHTLTFGSYRCENADGLFPFAFYDVMGAESEAEGGVNTQDIISALKGHIKKGYKFSAKAPLSESDHYYNRNPGLSDQMHCLVNVIGADRISMMDREFLQKWKAIRETASSMGIPQVILFTRIDCGCELTKENLQNVYKSKKIRDKMTECSNLTGIPMNLIFPVMNYHQETNIDNDTNCLMLDALKNMVPWANDYVKKCSNNQNPHQQSSCE